MAVPMAVSHQVQARLGGDAQLDSGQFFRDREVHDHHLDARVRLEAQALRQSLQTLLTPSHDDQVVTVLRKARGQRRAYARRRPGDECHGSFSAHASLPVRPPWSAFA